MLVVLQANISTVNSLGRRFIALVKFQDKKSPAAMSWALYTALFIHFRHVLPDNFP